jgi:hypothetical protein
MDASRSPRPPRRGRLLAALVLCAGVTTHAQGESPSTSSGAIDELDLARTASASGDAQLGAALRAPAGRRAAALAARAAPHARAPEALIPALASLACGRDPALAPEASAALLRLTDRLTASELATREVLQSDLRTARQALSCVEVEPAPRADIAVALAQLSAALDALLR